MSRITDSMATNAAFGVRMGPTCQIVRRSPAAETGGTEDGEMSADAEGVGHDAESRFATGPASHHPASRPELPRELPPREFRPDDRPDDRPDARLARRLRRDSGTGCALTVLMIWIGIGAALIDYRLVLASRVYCGAGDQAGDVFALNLEMLPRLVIGPIMAYSPYLLITFVGRSMSPLWRFAPSRTLIRLIAVLAGVAAAGALIVFDFAHIGTLAGHLGDSGLCARDNVPPWWPAWLPS
jgi:hypothetical protein